MWKEPQCGCFELLQLENSLICTFFPPAISRPVDSILGQFRCTGAALALRGRRALRGFRDKSKHVYANVWKRVQMVAAREEREATQWRRRSGPALGCLMRPVSDGRGGGVCHI